MCVCDRSRSRMHTLHRFSVSGQVQGEGGGGVIIPVTPPPWIRHCYIQGMVGLSISWQKQGVYSSNRRGWLISHIVGHIFTYITARYSNLNRTSGRRRSRILERGGGRGVLVINWQCAHRRCAPLGGLKARPLGTFEILDAFSCNLVHILSKNYI